MEQMTIQHEIQLAKYPLGRIILHMISLKTDHRVQWHLKGIAREFRKTSLTSH